MGPAAESIQGYTLTEDYYSLVVEFLKKRFGKKRRIIQAHMDAIIDLMKFDTMENNEVWSFLDTLKSNLRSVVPLGVQTELLAPLLIPLLMRKMPKKVIEKIQVQDHRRRGILLLKRIWSYNNNDKTSIVTSSTGFSETIYK